MVVAEQINHEARDGTLMIAINRDSNVFVTAIFESKVTGVIYSANYSQEDVAKLHRIFIGMPELFADFVHELPTITLDAVAVTAKFSVKFRRNVYEFDLVVPKEIYAGPEGVCELQQENRVLRHRVLKLIEHVCELTARLDLLESRLGQWDVLSQSFYRKPIRDCFTTKEETAHLIEQRDAQLIALVESRARDFNTFDYERMIDAGFDVNLHSGQTHYVFDLIDGILYHGVKSLTRVMFMLDHGMRNDHEYSGKTLLVYIRERMKYYEKDMPTWEKSSEPYATCYKNLNAIIAKFGELERFVYRMK